MKRTSPDPDETFELDRSKTVLNEEHARLLLGRKMLDRDGDPIGEISDVFVDDRTGEPTWVTVTTGWLGLSHAFVPLNKVQWSADRVQAAYDTATVKDAPRFATDQPLTPQDEDVLHEHYGLLDPAAQLPHQSNPDDPPGRPAATNGRDRAAADGSRGRLRRYQPRSNRFGAAATDLGDATVCQECGAQIATDMRSVHDNFHRSVAPPPGGFARHDIEVTEPATGVTRPSGGYARHGVDVAEESPVTPTVSTR